MLRPICGFHQRVLECREGNCCKQAWLLKNSFQSVSTTKVVRKLLNLRSSSCDETFQYKACEVWVPSPQGVCVSMSRVLFGEARSCSREIILLSGCGGEEKLRRLAGHSKLAEGLRIGVLSDVLNRWLA